LIVDQTIPAFLPETNKDERMNNKAEMTKNFLNLDCEAEVNKIKAEMQHIISKKLKRRGAVVGLSGGIDSSATVGLCQKAMGKNRVIALLMPERHSKAFIR